MTTIPACRACGQVHLETIVDLGSLPLPGPLANAGRLDEPEPRHPLEVVFCEGCGLVQLRHTLPPTAPGDGTGHSPCGISEERLHHARGIVEEVLQLRPLTADSLVIEVGSGDGCLLGHYAGHGIPVLGIEPSAELARAAERAGVPTLGTMLTAELVQELLAENRQADVIHCNGLLARVDDIHSLLAAMAALLADDGLLVLELPYVKDMVDGVAFDAIEHGQPCWFSLAALLPVCERHGLAIHEVRRMAIDGGWIRLQIGKQQARGGSVDALLALEQGCGLGQLGYYGALAGRVDEIKQGLAALLRDLRSQGKRIAAYGAGIRGCNLVNACGIGPEMIDYVVDRDTGKHGHFIPGAHLPICETERLLEDQPDYCLLLASNHAQEIASQQAEYRKRGGHFITALPEPEFI